MIAKAPTLADRIPACQARLLPCGHSLSPPSLRAWHDTISARPRLNSRRCAVQFLAVVTGPENTYFERALESLGVNTERHTLHIMSFTPHILSLITAYI